MIEEYKSKIRALEQMIDTLGHSSDEINKHMKKGALKIIEKLTTDDNFNSEHEGIASILQGIIRDLDDLTDKNIINMKSIMRHILYEINE